MKRPYVTHRREERVDEIECKVFIKGCDCNLLQIRGAAARGTAFDTHQTKVRFALKPAVVELKLCWTNFGQNILWKKNKILEKPINQPISYFQSNQSESNHNPGFRISKRNHTCRVPFHHDVISTAQFFTFSETIFCAS